MFRVEQVADNRSAPWSGEETRYPTVEVCECVQSRDMMSEGETLYMLRLDEVGREKSVGNGITLAI